MSADELIIRRPDDWHVHLRDGQALALVGNHTARQFGRAIVMPNLSPPVTTVAAAEAYRKRILEAIDDQLDFEPLMTAYLTDDIDPDEVARGYDQKVFTACKLYPANATTNSAAGVTDVAKIGRVLERMQSIGMPLLVHGEVTASEVDIFDREAVFLDTVLAPLMSDFPELKVVVEHITTEEAVAFVESAGDRVGATVTAHHLVINRNHILVGGIQPHNYCLPVAKRERHRLALRRAATSGSPKFFLGTDSAPHYVGRKESSCGCAGIFSAPVALESYVQTFEEEGALDRFEAFASLNGPRFYGLPVAEERVRLRRETMQVAETVGEGDQRVVVFEGGAQMPWRFAGRV
ncbi:MAG: dihydroorotase [Deltaproteobacteria bacterium]|nr:dihydroorotase [Deltaproteobacteria bacterium]